MTCSHPVMISLGNKGWEEVNFQPAGTGAGANYGWRVMEGNNCSGLGGGPPCFASAFTPPILEYTHALGCSVTGGSRYRGTANIGLAGYFVYGDFCRGRIWGASRYPSGVWANSELGIASFNISTFGEDEAGEMYVAAYNTGTIYRVGTPLALNSKVRSSAAQTIFENLEHIFDNRSCLHAELRYPSQIQLLQNGLRLSMSRK